ncbi:MAG: TniB family NTP-binding protein [Chloroflexota bacterium]
MTQSKPRSVIEQAHSVFILYPRLKELHQEICRCQQLSQVAGEPQCIALEGLTGAGKTTLIRQYATGFPRQETRTGTCVPVFYLETPSPATVKTMASVMLERLGDPAAHIGTIGSLNSRLIKLLQSCEVELVILDDFHHLIDTETDRVLAKVSDWLKVLIKETGIPFLVVGIEGKVERILQANAQLSRLFAAREMLRPFAWLPEQPETIQSFHVFVNTVEAGVGKPMTTAVPRTELLYRLYYGTEGVVGNVMNLLRYAVKLAEEQSQATLELPLLACAFERRLAKHMRVRVNPFTLPVDERFVAPG